MAEWYRLNLTEEEKGQLTKTIEKRKVSAKELIRSQVILATAENGLKKTDKEIAKLYGVSARTVERLRKRCCEEGLEVALKGKKREVFKDKKLTGEIEAKLAMLACSEPPEERESWTLQLLADKMVELNYIESISHTSVGILLKKMRLSLGGKRCG